MSLAEGAQISHKVVILGDSKVGKTSIITRQVRGCEPAPQPATVGCHCSDVRIALADAAVTLQLWDTAGQEVYRALVPIYLRGARAGVLVYDTTDRESFASLGHWHHLLAGAVGDGVALFVVGNKVDLEADAAIDDGEVRRFAELRGAQLFKCSAANGLGLAELFAAIARSVAAGVELQGPAVPVAIGAGAPRACC
jgi:small GTP-binding protein